MTPEEMYTPGLSGNNPQKRRIIVLAIIVVVLLALIGISALLSHGKTPGTNSPTKTTGFAISTTDPNVNSFTNITQVMTVYFTQPVAASGLSVTSNPSFITASHVQGSQLGLVFKPQTLVVGQKYTITIQSISSTSGKKLTDQKITFTPTFQAPNYTGDDTLINVGLSSDQFGLVKNDISDFKQWAMSVAIDPNSVNHYKDSADDWSPWDVSFNMNIDGQNYKAVATYYDLEHIQLKIYDPASNALLFTEGTPGSY